MSLSELLSRDFSHVISRVDIDAIQPIASCGRDTNVTGYTEWLSLEISTVTLGWDWALIVDRGEVRCIRIDAPRSNVLLVDSHGNEYHWQANLVALSTIVDAVDWTDQTLAYVASEKWRFSQHVNLPLT
ncbi:MAG: DUF4902 domain-containing protein [Burkholderiales bacterium]|nr:DUF4902 domain-containing protein [Burkholderiales bacterium]